LKNYKQYGYNEDGEWIATEIEYDELEDDEDTSHPEFESESTSWSLSNYLIRIILLHLLLAILLGILYEKHEEPITVTQYPKFQQLLDSVKSKNSNFKSP
jgi:hypothetical protein